MGVVRVTLRIDEVTTTQVDAVRTKVKQFVDANPKVTLESFIYQD